MYAISLAEARQRFDELIDRVEAGETVEITRDGHPVARIEPIEVASEAPRKPIDVEAPRALTSRMTLQKSDFVREMRDSDRY
jgi:prevent-host-death family protein